MGDVETINFERHGEPMSLQIQTGAVPVSMFGRAMAKIAYVLTVDGRVQILDREKNHDARNASRLAQRVSVQRWQNVSEKRSELDWSEKMVVEYALHLLPPGFATGGGGEERWRWVPAILTAILTTILTNSQLPPSAQIADRWWRGVVQVGQILGVQAGAVLH